MNNSFRLSLVPAVVLILIASACGHKVVPPPPPPPPPAGGSNTGATSGSAGRPVIAEFSVEPSSIERGQSAVVRWNVTGSDSVSIDHGLGTVPSTGTQRVTPNESTTYMLTANGPGGEVMRSATITVTANAAATGGLPRNTRDNRPIERRLQDDLRDALFDYDSNNIRDDARAALTSDSDALKRIFMDFPTATVNVEGHCDERGSAEYNLGLGDRRASAARDFLVMLGVPADRLKTVSYGKERPICTESDEACFQRNRRAHFSVGQ